MSKQLRVASLIAVTATMISAIVGTAGSGAIAQAMQPQAVIEEPFTPALPAPVEAEAPAVSGAPVPVEPAPAVAIDDAEAVTATSLAELVRVQPQDELDRELHCLAGAVYFEAKGESLPGQLAVGRVVVARAKSGRFPGSYCGVVYQPSQFSFVRGRSMPPINKNSQHWRNAVAIAQIADDGSWRSPVEGALFFHATHVSPGWRLKRLARIDNHIFYR
ncbi:MAG: cell wall hydrolase [Novosphingobium sp.]|nr:cell wall hydrolase [Novosphingobium sp.]